METSTNTTINRNDNLRILSGDSPLDRDGSILRGAGGGRHLHDVLRNDLPVGLRYTVSGRPYVKKSNQRVVPVMRKGKPSFTKIDTPVYKQWHKRALQELNRQRIPAHPIKQRLNMKAVFYMPDRNRVDLSALYEGIQDVLVEVGVIADDNFKIIAGHDGSRVLIDKNNPRMEIELTPMEGELHEVKSTPNTISEETF
jgi:Holliday junction resolvase RusA-like endonuclease